MRNNKPPSFASRIYSVWYRHMRVYTRHLFSNGFPPFMEPLILLAGIGLGLGKYIERMDGVPYIQFLVPGLIVAPAMFTATFECTFGTFIRLEFDKAYDGMLGSPLTVNNLIIGEIFWAGTKGMFFSFAVLSVVLVFGVVPPHSYIFTPFIGFFTGAMFATIALTFTSFIKTINHINFYITGFISPMFFFSGVIFPLNTLPSSIRLFAELLPLVHSVRIVRAMATSHFEIHLLGDVLYIVLSITIFGFFAIQRFKKRMID
ncbi:MAG: ABC transporter permease [SAR324 cluster bacterium]|nr:ABC transporter permease [SAR324 cluster bacterium]